MESDTVYYAAVTSHADKVAPTILFGAFDRHNFGDLLFPHVCAALLEDKTVVFAGLAERDLRIYGGHRVSALAQLAAHWGGHPVNIIHVGGELLTCDAWQAAVMLLPPDQAQATIARFEADPVGRGGWVCSQIGVDALAPYTLSRKLFPRAASIIYNAVGGVDLGELDPSMRTEVLAKLRSADAVGVRDRQTLVHLEQEGIPTCLLPDPATMVAELFGTKIYQRSHESEIAQILEAFPQGYLAVQFSADFGDDATLAEIADQLQRVMIAHGLGVVLFRAGGAPWHDDLDSYRRLAMQLPAPATRIFSSLNLWDICALITHSRGYLGSSLHGRIVAMAFAHPRLGLCHPAQAHQSGKQVAYASTWEAPGMPGAVAVQDIAQGVQEALATDPAQRQCIARSLAARYRESFGVLCGGL